jgi:MFS transporter, DHA3 family, macrolide efflux protein
LQTGQDAHPCGGITLGPLTLAPRYSGFAFLFSKFVSTGGECVFLITLYWLVMNRGGGSADIARLTVAMTAPALLTVLSSGALIDRLNRRKIAQVMEAVRGVTVGAIGLSALSGVLASWQLYLAVALIGTATYTLWSCQSAMLPGVVGSGRIQRGNTLWQVAVQGGAILGPVTGGFIVGRFGTTDGIWVTASCYLCSAISLSAVCSRRGDAFAAGNGRRAFQEAARELRSNPAVRYAALFAVIPPSFVAIANVILIPFAREVLHASALSASTMDTLWGIGALAGSAGTAYLSKAARRPLPVSILMIAVGSAAVAAAPDTGIAYVFVVIVGYAVGWANVIFPSRIQETAHSVYLGRIFSAVQFATLIVTLASSALLGVVGNFISTRVVFLGTAVALAVAGGLVFRLVRRERDGGGPGAQPSPPQQSSIVRRTRVTSPAIGPSAPEDAPYPL